VSDVVSANFVCGLQTDVIVPPQARVRHSPSDVSMPQSRMMAGKPSARIDPIPRCVRILHVLRAMNRGGIETWLMHALRHIDRSAFHMDFLLATRERCDYDAEILRLGGGILRVDRPNPKRPLKYGRDLSRILSTHGPYDVVHSHEQEMSGYILRCAAKQSIPVRIAHSHNDVTRIPGFSLSLAHRLRARVLRHWIDQYATSGLACSRRAASALFGPHWDCEPRWRVLHYGIDLKPFRCHTNQTGMRAELGIGPTEFVIGHVGRFHEQKNHAFIIDVVKELATRGCRPRLLLVGDGELRPTIEERARRAGLIDSVIFAGVREDIPRLIRNVMDVFLFPSRFEGLGLVLLEAQAAGIPCVVSDVVPPEASVVPRLVQTLSLSKSPVEWAEHVLQARSTRCDPREAIGALERSGFDIRTSILGLQNLYAPGWIRNG
jgi:glycosyltransferase involved in cell wall biosynthesis